MNMEICLVSFRGFDLGIFLQWYNVWCLVVWLVQTILYARVSCWFLKMKGSDTDIIWCIWLNFVVENNWKDWAFWIRPRPLTSTLGQEVMGLTGIIMFTNWTIDALIHKQISLNFILEIITILQNQDYGYKSNWFIFFVCFLQIFYTYRVSIRISTPLIARTQILILNTKSINRYIIFFRPMVRCNY